MIDGSSSGYPAGKGYPVAAQILEVHLGIGALVKAYDYRRGVPPEEENWFVERQAFEGKIVESHVPAGFRAVVYQILHCQLQNSKMAGTMNFFISGNMGWCLPG